MMKSSPKKNIDQLATPSAESQEACCAARDYSANPASLALSLQIPLDCGGWRIDQTLAKLCPQHSRSRLQNWIRAGHLSINGQGCNEPKRKLIGGETITLITQADPHAHAFNPEAIDLTIVYEDESLLVIDKPAGLVVHPGNGNWSGTLLNALLHYLPEQQAIPRAGIVHRLDKDTTGLMVVAKTLEAQTNLVRQLQARSVKRYYRALVRGIVENEGLVDAPIGRHPTQRVKMAVVHGKNGKPARTHYRVIERFTDCSLLDCALETGRTHQIRVHMAAIAHPLVGDPLYRGGHQRIPQGPEFARQALHARRLELIHPVRQEAISWVAKLPADFQALLHDLRAVAAKAYAATADEDWQDFADGPELIYAHDDSEDSEDVEDWEE